MALHVALLAVVELPEEFLKGRTRHERGGFLIVGSTLIRFSALVDANPHRNYSGFDLGDEIGKAGLSGRVCRYRCRRRGKGLSGKPSVSKRSANGEGRAQHRCGTKQRETPRRPDLAAGSLIGVCHDCISKIVKPS